MPGLRPQLLVRILEIDEAGVAAAEVEVPLPGVEQVKDDHLVAAVAEVAQTAEDLLRVVEEVGYQDDQSAPRQTLGEVVQDRGGAGVGLRPGAGELGQQHVEVALHRTGRHVGQGAVAEQGQADGVPLAQHQVGEGSRTDGSGSSGRRLPRTRPLRTASMIWT